MKKEGKNHNSRLCKDIQLRGKSKMIDPDTDCGLLPP